MNEECKFYHGIRNKEPHVDYYISTLPENHTANISGNHVIMIKHYTKRKDITEEYTLNIVDFNEFDKLMEQDQFRTDEISYEEFALQNYRYLYEHRTLT